MSVASLLGSRLIDRCEIPERDNTFGNVMFFSQLVSSVILLDLISVDLWVFPECLWPFDPLTVAVSELFPRKLFQRNCE